MSDRTPDGKSPTASGPPSESDRARAELQARIQKYIDQGLARLGTDSPRAELEVWGQRLLTWLALGLTEDQRGPTGEVRSPRRAVEEVLGAALFGSRRRGRSGGDSAFPVLLADFGPAALRAGWLEQQYTQGTTTHHFRQAELPALLVSVHWASSQSVGAEQTLPESVGAYGDWAEAVSIAIQAGGPIDPWLERLHAESSPRLLRERIAVTCGAIGGLPPGTPVTPALREAFHLATAALVWFAPAWREHNRSVGPHRDYREHPSPWFFEDKLFLSCISWLARGSQAVVGELGLPPLSKLWEEPPASLAKLVALGQFTLRLSYREARAVVALCMPAFGYAQGLWDADFWDEFFAQGRRLGSSLSFGKAYSFREQWLLRHAVPLWQKAGQLRELVFVMEHGLYPAALLLGGDLELGRLVYDTWAFLLASEPSDRLAAIWATAAASHKFWHRPEIRKLLVEDAPRKLRRKRLWKKARAALREHFQVGSAPGPSPDGVADSGYQQELADWLDWTRLCEFSREDWGRMLAEARPEQAGGWHALLAAGAPAQEVATLLLARIRSQIQHPHVWGEGYAAIRRLFEGLPPELLIALEPFGELPDAFFEPLCKWPAGSWLERLCEVSWPWPSVLRMRLVHWLFTYSEAPEVRDLCGIALVNAQVEGGGTHA